MLNNLGFAYNDISRFGDALDVLQKAIRLKPEFVEAHVELGYALYRLKRFEEAILSFNDSIKLEPNNELAHYYLGEVFATMNNRSAAMREYQLLQSLKSEYAAKLLEFIDEE